MRRRVAALRFSLNLPLGPGGAYGATAPSLVATSAATSGTATAPATRAMTTTESLVATSAAEFDSDAFEEMLLAAIEAEPVEPTAASFDIESYLRPGEGGELER